MDPEKIEMEGINTSPDPSSIPHPEETSTKQENGSPPVTVPKDEEIDSEEHLICEPDLPRRPARRQASIRGQERITKSRMVTAAPISKRVEKPQNVPLSGSEKAKLLTGINMYGSRDHEAIASHIPLRSTETVAHFIRKEKKEMQEIVREIEVPGPSFETEQLKEKREMDAPIEKWIFAAKNVSHGTKMCDVGHTLPKVLEWISEYEDHPDPADAGGVDYGAIYSHMAHLMTGDIPPDVNDATADKLMQLFIMLKDSVKASLPSLEKVIAALQSRPRDNPDTSSDPSDGRPSNNINLEDRYMHLDVHKLPGVDPIDIQSKLSPNTE